MSQNIPQHNSPGDYAQFTAIVTNGTVGSDTGGVVIRTPAAQRAAMSVYSSAQADSLFLPYSGGTMTGPVDMGGNAVTDVLPPINSTDAATKGYVDTQVAPITTAAPLSCNLNIGGNSIVNLHDPVGAADATTKHYVDTTTVSVSGDTMTGTLQMGGNAITQLPAIPVGATDATSKQYVDDTTVSLSGDTMTGILRMGGNAVTQLPPPIAASDAVNREYVDNTTLLRSGGTMTAAINMGNNAVTNVANPQNDGDAANMHYVYSTRLASAGGNMTGAIDMGNNPITRILDPVNPGDAATKHYADATFVHLSGSAMTGGLNMGGNAITNVATPQLPTDAVNKSYTDLLVAGVTFQPAAACYTVLNGVNFAYDGLQTITMTLTPSGGGVVVIDGYTVVKNVDRILINTSSNPAANGVYLYTTYTVSGASGIYTFARTGDLNGSPIWEFEQGALFFIEQGAIYGGALFVQTGAPPTTLGVSPITYSQYSAAKNIAAGANIAITGNSVAVASSLSGITSVTGLATPVNTADAANKDYVDTRDAANLLVAKTFTSAGYMPLANGTLTNATIAGASSAVTGTLTCTGSGKITGVPTPSAASDAVPKSYADLLVAGLTFKPAVACYATLAAPLNTFVYNGGQQITINVAATPIDGYTLQLNDRVLVNCADTPAANGVYVVTQLASPITLVRPADLDGTPLNEFQQGGLFYVVNGTVYGGALFVQSSASPLIIGTSPITYSSYAAAKNIAAGANIAITGSQVAVASSLSGITSVTGLAAPTNTADATNKSYVDDQNAANLLAAKTFTSAGYVPLTSGTLTNATIAGASSAVTGTLTCTGSGKITGVPTPSAASDAVPKSYADLLVAGLTFKPAVACYATLAAPLNTFVYNGGQQITINVAATPIDGYTLQLNDRVLVNCADTLAANGVYLVTQLAAPITLVRPVDLDGTPLSEFQQGGLFYVTNGTVYGGSLFVQSSASPSVLGTSPIVYSQYSAAKNISAGANVAITGNSVAVAPALTGITGVGLSTGDGSAGVLTVSKASGAASYALALPSAAPAANTFLKYDGASYAWSAAGSPLTGGSNINITSNAVGLNAAVSGLTSVALNGTSSADALTLSKASGGSSYALILPAAAPAASTYLKYDGSAYAWAAAAGALTAFTGATSGAAGTLGGVPAPQSGQQNYYLKGDGNWSAVTGGAVAAGSGILQSISSTKMGPYYPSTIWATVPNLSITVTPNASTSKFLLTANITFATTRTTVNFRFMRGSTEIGIGAGGVYQGSFRASPDTTNYSSWAAKAIGNYLDAPATTSSITYTIQFMTYDTSYPVYFNNANGGNADDTCCISTLTSQEITNNNNTISAFIGASTLTNGYLGYIPAPLSGQQNSYLRGDGTWQQANNAPTQAQYLQAFRNISANIPANTPVTFPKILTNIGTAISFTSPFSAFVLAPGYSYKLMCYNNYSGSVGSNSYQWYNSTSATLIGIAGNLQASPGSTVCQGPAIAYISTSVTTSVSVYPSTPNGLNNTINSVCDTLGSSGVGLNYFLGFSVTIEVVSNNNTITAFTGATASAAGSIGYLPAPPVGAQNSYLCGNGTWQSATVGPFAAQYVFGRTTSTQSKSAGSRTYINFPTAITITVGSAAVQTADNSFTITAGYSYKITAGIPFGILANNGTGADLSIYVGGVAQGMKGPVNPVSSGTAYFYDAAALCYVSPVVSSVVQVGFNYPDASCSLYDGAFITIEVVANNNNITAFSGATSTNDGIVGYIPAPKAGNQNMFLRGDGTWQNATIANYYMAYATAVARNGAITFGSIPVNIGTAIATTDNKSYTLASGYTYKITVMLTVNSYSDYNSVKLMNNGVQFGTTTYGNSNAGVFQYTNVGYILATTSASTFTTNYYSQLGTADTPLGFFTGITACSCLIIEVVSGNNAITAFTGCDATKDGIVGYIPPPKAGSQNMFLRGDGQWQNATAAIYWFGVGANTTSPFQFTRNESAGTSGVITTSSTTTSTFTLAPGYTYKCSCLLNSNQSAITNIVYQWTTNNATTGLFGVQAQSYNNDLKAGINNMTAIGYISPTASTTVSVAAVVLQSGSTYPIQSWVLIEVVSGNNAITAFKGATTNTDGGVGYIPAPLAGTQNSYLRGDGTWQQANNAPTAAIYLHMAYVGPTSDVDVPTSFGQPFPFNTTIESAGISGVITVGGTSTTTTFTLSSGYTYKCTAAVGYNRVPGADFVFQWKNITTGVLFGILGDLHSTDPRGNLAVGYIANTSPTSIIISLNVNSPNTPATYINTGLYPWCTIEVVSNNNTITAFTGATSVTNGTVGYIPAPLAGTQNSYLRGDGTWQQANNAPTQAQYLFATSIANQTVGSLPYAILFPDILLSSVVTALSGSTFTLLPFSTYKLSACIPFCSATVNYRWFNVTAGTYLGEGATNAGSAGGVPNMAFIATTVQTTVALYATWATGSIIYGQGHDSNFRGPWIIIEQLSNNNTITQFTGCTAYQNGSIGYIPAPPAGTQNSYLRGDGQWIQANNAPTAAQYYHATLTGNPSANTNIVFNSGINSSGSAISTSNGSSFTLQPGYTYKIYALVTYNCENAGSNAPRGYLQLYSNGVAFGTACDGYLAVWGGAPLNYAPVAHFCGIPCIAFGYLSVPTTVTTLTIQTGYSSMQIPGYINIEVVSNNNTITAFTGATALAAGSIGYIPAPTAGKQNYVLGGAGNWVPSSPAFATYYSMSASGVNLMLTGTNTKVPFTPRGINIDSGGTKIIPTVPGYYECRASWNSGGSSADSNINISFNGGGLTSYGTSQVGVYQSGVVESILLFNGTTDYIQITNSNWSFGQAQVTVKWFSS